MPRNKIKEKGHSVMKDKPSQKLFHISEVSVGSLSAGSWGSESRTLQLLNRKRIFPWSIQLYISTIWYLLDTKTCLQGTPNDSSTIFIDQRQWSLEEEGINSSYEPRKYISVTTFSCLRFCRKSFWWCEE